MFLIKLMIINLFRIYQEFSAVKMQINFFLDAFKGLAPLSLGIALAALIITAVYLAFKDRNLPPGTLGLPYFGYWAFMNDVSGHLKLYELKKKYGDITSFTYTGRLFINLGSIKAVREATVTKADCFTERMTGPNIMNILFQDGVAFTKGEEWQVTRKFFLLLLKERGAKSIKSYIAGPLYDSIRSTVTDLKAKNGEPVNLIELLTQKCNTFLRLSLFGEVGVSEEQIREFNEMYAIQTQSMTPTAMMLTGTFAKYFLFPFIPNYFASMKCKKKMQRLLYGIIDEHKRTYNPDKPHDIIDEYIAERDKRQSKGDPTAKYFTDKLLMGSLIQFMGDGVFAVAGFTSMLMKQLLEDPEEQEKVYNEIVEVIGLDRQPTIEDKSRLTYFNAYMQEALRTSDFFNFFPSQECTKETTLGGYKIPKGAVLVVNFYCCHRDPEVYEEPEKFNSSRFIPTEGKKRPELPIPFGVGKRSCVGEGFVMMQVFLLLTTLIQNFQLTLSGGKKKLSYEEFMSDQNLSICATPRNNS